MLFKKYIFIGHLMERSRDTPSNKVKIDSFLFSDKEILTISIIVINEKVLAWVCSLWFGKGFAVVSFFEILFRCVSVNSNPIMITLRIFLRNFSVVHQIIVIYCSFESKIWEQYFFCLEWNFFRGFEFFQMISLFV